MAAKMLPVLLNCVNFSAEFMEPVANFGSY